MLTFVVNIVGNIVVNVVVNIVVVVVNIVVVVVNIVVVVVVVVVVVPAMTVTFPMGQREGACAERRGEGNMEGEERKKEHQVVKSRGGTGAHTVSDVHL